VRVKVELDDAEDTSERDGAEHVRDRGRGSSVEEVNGSDIVVEAERASAEVGEEYSDDSEPLPML